MYVIINTINALSCQKKEMNSHFLSFLAAAEPRTGFLLCLRRLRLAGLATLRLCLRCGLCIDGNFSNFILFHIVNRIRRMSSAIKGFRCILAGLFEYKICTSGMILDEIRNIIDVSLVDYPYGCTIFTVTFCNFRLLVDLRHDAAKNATDLWRM